MGIMMCSPLTHGTLSWEQPLLGTYLVGILFLAADVESAPQSKAACWLYGFLVGALVMIIRSADPGHPDGVVFAVLLGCLFAPLLDRLFIWRSQRG